MTTQELIIALQTADPWDMPAHSEELHTLAASRLSEMETENKRLREIAGGAASMRFLDAEDVKGEIVFRFTMPGNQLFNKPQFHVEARAALTQEKQHEPG